jgi:hypothetical protein
MINQVLTNGLHFQNDITFVIFLFNIIINVGK